MEPSWGKRRVTLRLIHDGTQPGKADPEPVRFGLQDLKAEIHPGSSSKGRALYFEFSADVKGDEKGGQPVFSGPFCHGAPKVRFIYLSWKREGVHAAPWAWRIKIPLSGIDWAAIREADGSERCLQADVTGRRPHAIEPIKWAVAPRDRKTVEG